MVPVYSLYGAHDRPTPAQLAPLDVVVGDFQDIGCRFYTYAWTLVKLMQVAALPMIVFFLVSSAISWRACAWAR